MMFQSAGSITVKVAGLFLNKWIKQCGIDAAQVIFMHDEFQIECKEEYADEVEELAKKAFTKAGEWLKMNVEIVGEAKRGLSWADTH
jgi:DNA polymerase I-like protein with 3'-5' exonuclease and polymerase domains